MNITKTNIEGVYIIEPKVFEDSRGYFFESFNEFEFNKNRSNLNAFYPIQDNESKSSYGVLRGLHFQEEPYAQAKLVRVVSGEVYDVAVDLRYDSPTRGKYVGVRLSGENKIQFFIPEGFAHGFVVLSDTVVFQYKCNELYHPEAENGIKWDDETIGIEWPVPINEIKTSEKDKKWQTYNEYFSDRG